MEKRDLLYEGKAKKVYKTDDPSLYIIEYKDDATAFNVFEARHDCRVRDC
jgi:phosphoribosylaminoimidazole-succinocarboxamide synthase